MPDNQHEFERLILEMTRARGRAKSICPSEVARAMSIEGWRDLMPLVRDAATRLARRGEIRVLQGGRQVDPASARGPIRLQFVMCHDEGVSDTEPNPL